jgi:hypothetical protein
VTDNVVTLTENTSTRDGTRLRTDRGTLRFIDQPTLNQFLSESGFTIEAQFGDWQRMPFTPTARAIITIVRKD